MIVLSGICTSFSGFSSFPLYLDPGSGSYLIQLLLAAVLGGAFMVKVFWQRIRDFFSKSGKRKPEDPTV